MRRHPCVGAALFSALLVALLLSGCNRLSDERAESLVRAYNDRVTRAFRAGDARLVEGVTGPEEAKKLTGLIGVKLDVGITLDAQLLELKVLGIDRRGDEVTVSTDERWYYQDRRIGSGERVGQDSTDHYRMRYRLTRVEGRWVVAAIEFAEPPAVGRTEVPNKAEAPAMHGFDARRPQGAVPPGPERGAEAR